MLTYTVCSSRGGTGQSTLAWNLAAAHTQRGRGVLAIDLAETWPGLTVLSDAIPDNPREFLEDQELLTDNLCSEPPADPSDSIYESPEGVDIIPTTPGHWGSARQAIKRKEKDPDFELAEQLDRSLRYHSIYKEYDTIIIDASAMKMPLKLALGATQNIVVPCTYSGKSKSAITDIRGRVHNFEDITGVRVETMILAPTQVGYTTLDHETRDEIISFPLEMPVEIRDKPTLFDKCWKRNRSLFDYAEAEDHDHEPDEPLQGTLDRFDELAAYLEERVELSTQVASQPN